MNGRLLRSNKRGPREKSRCFTWPRSSASQRRPAHHQQIRASSTPGWVVCRRRVTLCRRRGRPGERAQGLRTPAAREHGLVDPISAALRAFRSVAHARWLGRRAPGVQSWCRSVSRRIYAAFYSSPTASGRTGKIRHTGATAPPDAYGDARSKNSVREAC
jgi:hypothetical protein